jgi:hypothetical protein
MPVIWINMKDYEILKSLRKPTPGTGREYESFATVVKRVLEERKK